MNARGSQLLRYDPTGCFLPDAGLAPGDWAAFEPRLARVQWELAVEDLRRLRDGPVPPDKQPLDAAFLDLPDRLLGDYNTQRRASELFRILRTAERLRETVDRVVVVGSGASLRAAQAIMDACCEPHFNELSRAERGSRPRMYFAGDSLDNDAAQGLLHLLAPGRQPAGLQQRWALLVLGAREQPPESLAACRLFLAALRGDCDGDPRQLAERLVVVAPPGTPLFDLAHTLGCRDGYASPPHVGGRFSVLSAAGLLPAAVLGRDVVALLEGAAAMNRHFREAPPAENVVLRAAGVGHLLETRCGVTIRVLAVWAAALESLGRWYGHLLAESPGRRPRGLVPLTAVYPRDLPTRPPQPREARCDQLTTHVVVDQWRCDPLATGSAEPAQEQLDQPPAETLPDLLQAAVRDTITACRAAGQPAVELRLPAISEATLGQLLQMLMLATVVEGRLLGVNPHG